MSEKQVADDEPFCDASLKPLRGGELPAGPPLRGDAGEEIRDQSSFGKKTIGSFAGTVLLLNNMMGVGLPLLPMLLQQAGWVTPVLCIVAVALLSGYSATMLTEAMNCLPGNKNFEDRVEYASLAKFYLGSWPYFATQLFLNLALLSLNLVSILETIQVMDWTLVGIFGCTYGFTLWPVVGFRRMCPVTAGNTCDSPFGQSMVVGLGYVVIMVVIIPLGYWNLEDNIAIQVVSMAIQLLIIAKWCITFLMKGFHLEAVTAFGTGLGQSSVLGQVLLNYAFIMSVPSWCNEKRRSSNVNRVVWSAVSGATVCYLAVGIMGALAFPNLHGEDILTAINNADPNAIIDHVSVYLYPLIAVSTSIPIFSIIMRYNIVENGLMSARWASVVSVLLPWLLVIPLTAGNSIFNVVADFFSIAFQLPINLILPFVIYAVAMRRKAYLKPCLCEPGPCPHDISNIIDDSEPRTLPPMGMVPVIGAHDDVSINDAETASLLKKSDNEQIIAVDVAAHPKTSPKWSSDHPRCARFCCTWWVRWKDAPPINHLKPFSIRHPWLAERLPHAVVRYLDKEEPVASYHSALPQKYPLRLRQCIGFTLAGVSALLFAGALALAIWGLVDPIHYVGAPNSTTC